MGTGNVGPDVTVNLSSWSETYSEVSWIAMGPEASLIDPPVSHKCESLIIKDEAKYFSVGNFEVKAGFPKT